MSLTIEQKTKFGEDWAIILNIQKIYGYNPNRYSTTWGTKTSLGIFEIINLLVEESKIADSET
jgi:hypothetical protein